MEHWLALVQTILWVGLIGWIVYRFQNSIQGLLAALQKRVETGSAVKAGPFEISADLRPAATQEQKEKLETEIQDEVAEDLAANRNVQSRSIASLALEAEDLALRAIQAEYNIPILRQLSAGFSYTFDGVFTLNGRLVLVEVKFVRTISSVAKVRHSLEKVASSVLRTPWRNIQLILVIVFDNPAVMSDQLPNIHEATKTLGIETVVRSFSMAELRGRFGTGAP